MGEEWSKARQRKTVESSAMLKSAEAYPMARQRGKLFDGR
jgi:hypothetical protein